MTTFKSGNMLLSPLSFLQKNELLSKSTLNVKAQLKGLLERLEPKDAEQSNGKGTEIEKK